MQDYPALSCAALYDRHEGKVQVASALWLSFGKKVCFSGAISTVKCLEDNSLVRTALEEPGAGRVLVVDGGGSMRCALLGDQLAVLGMENGWAGVIVYGCVRDTAVIATLDTGVKALGANPRRSVKQGLGERDIPVEFADVRFTPGAYAYADPDGILVSPTELT